MPAEKKPQRDEQFVGWLERLARAREGAEMTQGEESRARAALATLKRGLGRPPGTALEMYRYVGPYISPKDPQWIINCYLLVAALFAHHPLPGGKGSMGSVMAEVKSRMDSESVEKRFLALLNAHHDDLPRHLRHAVSLANSKEVPVNWRQLLKDIKNWNNYHRFVQKQWARDFWSWKNEPAG